MTTKTRTLCIYPHILQNCCALFSFSHTPKHEGARSGFGVWFAIMIGSKKCGQTHPLHPPTFARLGLALWSKSSTWKDVGLGTPPPHTHTRTPVCKLGGGGGAWAVEQKLDFEKIRAGNPQPLCKIGTCW